LAWVSFPVMNSTYYAALLALVLGVGCGGSKEKTTPNAQAKAKATPKAEPKVEAKRTEPTKAVPVNIADPIVEKAIRKKLKKPEGVLTEADLAKVIYLNLYLTQITNAGLKELAKLQKLERLVLSWTKVTKAGVDELKEALPKCKIRQ